MDSREVMKKVAAIIEAHGTGLLATVDEDGNPRVRWMTPTLLPDSPGAVYALTPPRFAKASSLHEHRRVEWLFQTPTLDEVISLRGTINLVETPSLRAEVLEVLGQRLATLWKFARDARDLVVLETVVEEASVLLSMQGRKENVRFQKA